MKIGDTAVMFDLTLSFDNGPGPSVTPAVLDELARRQIRCTFFVIGEKLTRPQGRKLAERAHAEGHWIGNHSWTHSVPLGQQRGLDIAEREIGRTQDAMAGLVHPHRYFRPFGGGGNLDRRLMSGPAWWNTSSAAATPACCGIRSRATGPSRMAGSSVRWPIAARKDGR